MARLQAGARSGLQPRIENILREHRDDPGPYTVAFRGLELAVTPGVFSPRYGPSSEIIAHCLRVELCDTVLDLCTGSGALAALAATTARSVIATDISPLACECARLNMERLGFSHKTEIRQGDLLDPIAANERFSLVIFNPPFMDGKPVDWLEAAMFDEGHRAVCRFYAEIDAYLEEDGRILTIFGTSGDMELYLSLVERSPFEARLVRKETNLIDFYVWELRRKRAGSVQESAGG